MTEPLATLRFLCWHTGPRGRQYGIPAVLHSAGMLERFYTDFCLGARSAALLRAICPPVFRSRFVDNLLSRSLPPELPRSRVRTLPLREMRSRWRRGNAAAIGPDLDARLRQRVRADGFESANAVYSIGNGDLEVLEEAKAQGLAVVHDHILTPDVGVILREERARFAGIEPQDSEELVWEGIRRDRAQWALADLVLAPSEYSRDAIVRLGGPADRVRVVPYGINADWLEGRPAPEPGRILFVGSAGLRKGTHYLAEAARLLRDRGVPCEVIAVGRHDPEAVSRPAFEGPTYLGAIPRSRVRSEFLRADVFVHPSLAEGCAIAHLEALACGLPVIATPNAGPVIRDGIEGFIVPARDGKALADCLERIIVDRRERRRLGANASKWAREFTWDAYRARLVTAFSDLLGQYESPRRGLKVNP